MTALKLRTTYFVVEGAGQFPFDMLRYDQCYPVSESADSPHLAGDYAEGMRRVMLRTDFPGGAPTHGRWRSFGWRVVAVGANHAYRIEAWRDDMSRPSMFAEDYQP